MSIWVISDGCTIDEQSFDQTVTKGDESIHLRRQCWDLLIALLDAKKHNQILTFENIGEILWSKEGGWDEARKASLKKVLDEIRAVIGSESIGNTHGVGYHLTYNIREVLVPRTDKRSYYEKLWQNHHKGDVRDLVATGAVRELIDFFVLPSITTQNGDVVAVPFSGSNFSKFLMAGSGFGKSTLLDILLLCNVADALCGSGSPVLSQNSKKKITEYERLRESLFGASAVQMFPVFIHSDSANTVSSYSSLLDLAEAKETACFKSMVDEAHCAGSLLFLIDSIDEVESEKLTNFLESIKKMRSDYPNANVVFASRFLGKKAFPFEYDLLQIKELGIENIKKITFSMLSQNDAEKFLERLNNNSYLRSLVKNPFMLMTVLETKGDRLLHRLLESIVNAIIDRRWDKHHYDISSEDIKMLLGFLACKFVFENKTDADLSEIRQCFIKAGDNLKLHGVSYDVPSQNVEYFLKTLSSQSGILNIINKHHVEKYLFQDTLVMCWLAANYINKIINESGEIHDRDGMRGIWANTYWLNAFLRSISSKETYLSASAVNVLVMTLVMSSEISSQDIQKSVLYFLICRDATSLNEQEQLNIRMGYKDLVQNSFGENDITNHPSSDSLKLICKMLDAHAKASGTADAVPMSCSQKEGYNDI